MGRITDPYSEAQFSSLWQVVVHATEQGTDRFKVYRHAATAMVKRGQWGAYRMLYSTVKSSGFRYHVGYRYANPKDWFTLTGAEVDGPFRSKRAILRKHGVRKSSTLGTGRYQVTPDVIAFTRDQASHFDIEQEVLP